MNILTRIAVLAVSLAFVIVSGVEAEEYEYVKYTIQKGDTLWDISGLELNDNFQWPMVWKVNPHIKNPDRIYPGQVINIPVSFLLPTAVKLEKDMTEPISPVVSQDEIDKMKATSPISTAAIEITPKRGEFLISREALLETGYITKNVPNKGKIKSSPFDRSIFSQYDDIYIDCLNEAIIGDKFYIIRNEGKVSHPSKFGTLGSLVKILGVLEVREAGTKSIKARIIEAFDDIRIGDNLDNYYEIDLPFSTGDQRYPHVDAVVVATKYLEKKLSGKNELVFIDKGRNDGLRETDILMTLVRGTDDMQNGMIQLVNVRDTTSLALIVKSESDIKNGDIVTGVR